MTTLTATMPTDLRQLLLQLPKVELHRHLEGSIRLSTLVDVAEQFDIDLPARDMDGLRKHVQITQESPSDSAHFLSKFTIIRRFLSKQSG